MWLLNVLAIAVYIVIGCFHFALVEKVGCWYDDAFNKFLSILWPIGFVALGGWLLVDFFRDYFNTKYS
jgi:hypothetical protein